MSGVQKKSGVPAKEKKNKSKKKAKNWVKKWLDIVEEKLC